MFYRLLMLFGGAVRVRATGTFVERFINLAAHDGVQMWDIERGEGELFFKLPARSFRRLRRAAKASGVRLRVVGRHGLPFVYGKYRRRIALWLGAALFVASLFAASRFIWDIEVIGCEALDSAHVEEVLSELGVKRGAYIAGIDIAQTQQLAMLKIEELSFIAINVKGVRAEIEVRERVPAPERKTPEGVRSLAASFDGLIESIDVFRGTALVKRGASVQKGDILVSGEIPSESGEPRYVAAEAKVIARTWRTGRIVAARLATARVYTGRSEAKYTLLLPFCSIKLYIDSSISWPEYDKISREYRASLFGAELPLALRADMYGEVLVLTRVQTDEELEALCLAKLDETVADLSPGREIQAVRHWLEVGEEGAQLRFEIEALEDIATPVPLY
ncbi:MAG TPA: sporulation protein YqfD [Candidatus Acidoferrum sp.]|nr:sporulation protein YqfD [Candidatus Acidoferrum sp.]